jgi:hypothetical protein
MSVHQDSLDMSGPLDPAPMEATPTTEGTQEESVEVEDGSLRTDSLAMFGAAIGGAVLGMLLTLLVLALINGGTLSFAGGVERMDAMEANLERVNENVGAVSTNVDIVAAQSAAIRGNLDEVEAVLTAEMATQADEIVAINTAIGILDQTRTQFDIFVGAMADALVSMEEAVSETADNATAFAEETSAAASVELPVPMVANSADVPAQNVVVIVFADVNGDGALDGDETSLMGTTVSLLNAEGEPVTTVTSTEAGAQFEALDAGEYQLVVEDALGYELLSLPSAVVSIGEGDAEGFVVYIPATTATE